MSEIKTGVYINPTTKEEITFAYRTKLDIKDKIRFVSDVCDVVVSEQYYSFLKDLIFDFEIIGIFTDIDVSEIIRSDDYIGEVEKIVTETKIVDIVKSNIDKSIIDELMVAIDNNIEYRTGVHYNPVENSLVELIKIIKDKVESIDTNTIIELANQLSPIANNLTADNIVESYAKSPAFLESMKDRENRIRTVITNDHKKKKK